LCATKLATASTVADSSIPNTTVDDPQFEQAGRSEAGIAARAAASGYAWPHWVQRIVLTCSPLI